MTRDYNRRPITRHSNTSIVTLLPGSYPLSFSREFLAFNVRNVASGAIEHCQLAHQNTAVPCERQIQLNCVRVEHIPARGCFSALVTLMLTL